MRVIISFIFVLLAHSSIGQSPKNSSPFTVDSLLRARQTGAIGKSFPQFTALSDGQTVSNEAFRGKVVLINFWFENCLPCMAEMEALNALHHQLKDQNDFLFVSFTWDKP
jgi:thiol-disulfide isomerase/thioredoxin